MDITSEIFEILEIGSNYSESNETTKQEILSKMQRAWDDLPKEKLVNDERVLIAEFLIDEYTKFKNFDLAYSWANILLSDRQDNLSNVGMVLGKIDFEAKKYDSAYEHFDTAFKDSKGREFEGEDPKYKDFYLNPEKYIKE
jgi:hypothetical protein